VRHVRILTTRLADAVPAAVEVARHALSSGDVSDGLRDIAEAVARLRRADAGFEPGPGGIDETLILVVAITDDDGTGGVGDPTVDGHSEVEGQQIAVGHHIAVGLAVEDSVVDRQADDIAEGPRTE